jgi:hypothetical protein
MRLWLAASLEWVRRHVGLVGFVAMFMVLAAWSFAAPYDGTPDENAHVQRAAGIMNGGIAPPAIKQERVTGGMQTVPAGLLRDNCWKFRPTASAACAEPPSADRTPVRRLVLAAQYNPVYYMLVGWPVKIISGMPAIIAIRLLSAAGAAALLAAGLSLLLPRSPVFAAASAVAITPMVAHIGAGVNPNGWEIAAGFAFFASGLHVLDRAAPDLPNQQRAYWLLGISGGLILTLRSGGLLIFAVALLAMSVPLKRDSLLRWWRVRPLRRIAIAWSVTFVAAATWLLVMRPNQLGTESAGTNYSVASAARQEFMHWGRYVDQLVGVLSHLDTRTPGITYLIWQALAAFLLLLGILVGTRTTWLQLAIIAVGGGVVPSAIQVAFANQAGFILQARYMLPVLIGAPLIAGLAISRSEIPANAVRRLVTVIPIIVIPLHLVFLVWGMRRWQQGLGHGFNPFVGAWLPFAGPVVPLVLACLGLTGYFVLLRAHARTPSPVEEGEALLRPLASPSVRGEAVPVGSGERSGGVSGS